MAATKPGSRKQRGFAGGGVEGEISKFHALCRGYGSHLVEVATHLADVRTSANLEIYEVSPLGGL